MPLLTLLLLSLGAAGPASANDPVFLGSDSPGCRSQFAGGFGAPGGCNGTTSIFDVDVSPKVRCLGFGLNNCNNGVLEVFNECKEDLELGGLSLPYMKAVERLKETRLKLVRTPDGKVVAIDLDASPRWDELRGESGPAVSARGTVGGAPFKVSVSRSGLKSSSVPPCLKLRHSWHVNGVPDVASAENRCEKPVRLAGTEVPPSLKRTVTPGGRYTFELFKDPSGSVAARLTQGNYGRYVPADLETLSVPGRIGSQPFTLTYKKTKPCP